MRWTLEAADKLLLTYVRLNHVPRGAGLVKSREIEADGCSLLVVDTRPDGRIHGVEMIFTDMTAEGLAENVALVELLLAKAGVGDDQRAGAVDSLLTMLRTEEPT